MAQAPGSRHLDEAWVRGVSGWGGTAWLGQEPRVRVALALWPQLSGSWVKPAFLSLQDLCPNQTTGFLRGSHRVTLPGATPWRKLGQTVQAGGEVRAGRALHHIRRGAWTRSRWPGGRGLGSAGAFPELKGGSCWEGARWSRGLVAGLAGVGLPLPQPSCGPCRRSGCIAVAVPRDCSPSDRAPRRQEKPFDLAQARPVPRSPQPT